MKHSLRRFWKNNRGFIIFLLLFVGFRSAVADWNEVPTGSMKPTIQEGDRITVNKLAYDIRIPLTHISLYRLADPKRGEIVVFDSKQAGKRLVKRVIGLPGDTVAMHNNRLVINGQPLRYRELKQDADVHLLLEDLGRVRHRIKLMKRAGAMSSFAPVTVPPGHYLVLGDNRDNSADSRYYGFVPRDEIIGRSSMVVISLDYGNYYLPRSDRFFKPL